MKVKNRPRLIPYELRKIVGAPGISVLFFGYLLILTAAVCFPRLRDAYLHLQETDFLLFWVFGGILPVFVTLTLVLGISPLFAGDIQNHTKEEFSTCAFGRESLMTAKTAAVLLYTLLVNLAYQGTTFLFSLLWSRLPDWSAGIETVYPGTDFKMTVGAYCVLAAFLIFAGSLVAAFLTAYLSARSRITVIPCFSVILFCAMEYVFLKLGGATLITNYLYNINLCKAMNPVVNLYAGELAPFDTPLRAMGIMLICFATALTFLCRDTAQWRHSNPFS